MEEQQRIREGNRVSLIGIAMNLILATAKLIIGMLSGMISITADAVNNYSDACASIVSLIGFRLSSRPADDDHPFGHARYEYISGLVVSILVMNAGLELLKGSVSKLMHPETVNLSFPMFLVLILSICGKMLLFAVYKKTGKRISSTTVLAAAEDSRNDCIATGAVLIAAVIMAFTGINLDGIMGIAVALFVLWSGIGLVKETAAHLLGTAPDEATVQEIERCVLSYEGVLGTHDLMVHDYGPGHCFASVHVEVPAEKSVLECHELIDRIEEDFRKNQRIQLTIHYDPIVTTDEAVGEIRRYMRSEAEKIYDRLNIHDMRIVPGVDNTNVIFDVVIPHTCPLPEQEVVKLLKRKLREKYPNHTAVIKVDHGYVSLST